MLTNMQRVDGYKNMLRSHNNDTAITRRDFASLMSLETLAKKQIAGLKSFTEGGEE